MARINTKQKHMPKTGGKRRIIHFGILVATIIAGAFTVANVFAAAPPSIDLAGLSSCTNGQKMACSGPSGLCRVICASTTWQLCSAADLGKTILSNSYICNTDTYWKQCINSTLETISGKTCTEGQWIASDPTPAGSCNDDEHKDASEQCDFGANNNGITKSSTQPLFTLFSIPGYGLQSQAYTCSSDCQMEQTLVSGGSCGDGTKQFPPEQCDGAAIPNCVAAECQCSTGYEPPSPEANECQPLCGNGKTDGDEECDGDGNCNNAPTCTCKTGFISQADDTPPVDDTDRKICVPTPATCGNGKIDGTEACDGGLNCDSEICLCDDGYIKDPAANPLSNPGCKLATPAELCGNGQRDAGEQCDKDGGQHCGNTCQCSSGYKPIPGSPNTLNCQKIADESEENTQCDDNEDNDNDGKEDYPEDPGCSSKSDNSEVDPPKGAVQISEAEIFPVGFNPNMADTKITYKLSGSGIVELTILDESGVKVVTLIDNEEIDGNLSYTIPWDGTDSAEGDGEIVAPGKYFFKLTVKASEEAEVSDTKTGEINVIYAEDFEGVGVGSTGNPNGSVSVLHNSPPKNTSGTGPEAAIYLLFPVIGYIGARYARKRK